MQCPLESGGGADLMIAYGSGGLTGDVAADFERHLLDCPECSRIAAAQRAVWGALDDWEPVAISADFDRRLYARIAEEQRQPWYLRLWDFDWSWRPAIPAAAACTAIVAILLLKGPVMDRLPQPHVPPRSVDLEQVERALDDIDMLKQLGVAGLGSQTSQPSS